MIQLRRKRATLEMGQDAFLDIVANLVGVLIILVVVLGTQSHEAIHEIVEDSVTENHALPEQMSALEEQAMRAAAAQRDSNRLETTIRQFDNEIASRNQQRAMLLDLLAEARIAWEDSKQHLNADATEAAAKEIEISRIEKELAELSGERERIEGEPEPIIAVAHLPTPMAKTVFGDELHFRLKDNLVSVVPIERLIEEMKQEMQRSLQSSREGQLETAIGPVRGYVAHVEMNRSSELISRGGQIRNATGVEVTGMTIEPLKEPHGQHISNVLAGSSELDIELAGRDPATTTITVWVYPESFAAFRQLKEHLYRKGFATAARPLPQDFPIGVSRNGSRSTAQ